MDEFAEFLDGIANPEQRARMEEVFSWIFKTFPTLEPKVGWNQPMFTDHGTYIIGFSVSKAHMAVAPELAGMERFTDAIEKSGYGHTKLLFRIPWKNQIDYDLLAEIIQFNIDDKAGYTKFWR